MGVKSGSSFRQHSVANTRDWTRSSIPLLNLCRLSLEYAVLKMLCLKPRGSFGICLRSSFIIASHTRLTILRSIVDLHATHINDLRMKIEHKEAKWGAEKEEGVDDVKGHGVEEAEEPDKD